MEKLKNLVHYICHKCNGTGKLGATKLNKVLWYCDVFSYITYGAPITNEQYKKQQFGPVPSHIMGVLNELVGDGKLKIEKTPYYGYMKKEYFSLQEADISGFTAPEISLVDDVIGFVCDEHTASSISAKTHDHIWEAAEIGEEIPLSSMFLGVLGEVNEADIQWAKAQQIAA